MSTPRKLTLSGHLIATAGRLSHLSWDAALAQRVGAAGSKLSDSISEQVTLFVAGTRAGSKLTQAQTRGAQIITEAQFSELLAEGEIELPPRATIDHSLDLSSCIGELRSLLNAPASSEAWSEILHIAERCDEERAQELVSYVGPQLTRWGRDTCWKLRPKEPLLSEFSPKYWESAQPRTQLCVAPPLWMLEALRGEHSTRHQLARALNWEGMKLNGNLAERLLAHPGWCDIRALSLGIQNRLSKGFYKKLAAHPMCQTLEELWLFDVVPEQAFAGLDLTPEHFPALRLLHYRSAATYNPAAPQRIAKDAAHWRKVTSWLSDEVELDPITHV